MKPTHASRHLPFFTLLAITLSCGLTSPVAEAVPAEINFQGFLASASGIPENGLFQMSLSLYDAPTGGNVRYQEDLGFIEVDQGFYRFQFGAAGGNLPQFLATYNQLYLELQIDGEPQSPRTALLAVPYALHSATSADNAALAQTVDSLGTNQSTLQQSVNALNSSQSTQNQQLSNLQQQLDTLLPQMAELLTEFRVISVSGTLDFGSVEVGTTATRTFTVTNNGFGSLTINSIEASPHFASTFSGSIPQGQSREITLSFTPPAPGLIEGASVRVLSNATRGENELPITARGAEPGNAPQSMVRVPAGSLPSNSALVGTNVAPLYIGQHEATWGEWQEVASQATAYGYNGLASSGDGCASNHPVHSISWYEALQWCNLRSEIEGLTPVYTDTGIIYRNGFPASLQAHTAATGYRLPTEAEWEFAARGANLSQGFTYSGSNSFNAVARVFENSAGASCNLLNGYGTWPTGQLQANELNIFDMSGNVAEWCWDQGSNGFRLFRGGSWRQNAQFATVNHRDAGIDPASRNSDKGLRLARRDGSIGVVLALNGSLDFGRVEINSTSTRILTVENIGIQPLTITGLSLPSADLSADWTSGVLSPGATQTITLTFAPSTTGLIDARILVLSNAISGANGLSLHAEAAAPAIPDSMAFVEGGTLPVGSPHAGTSVAGFLIDKHEITLELWQDVQAEAATRGYSDLIGIGQGCNSDHPVHSISWFDALKWCNLRSESEGLTPAYMINSATYRTGETTPTLNPAANGYRLPDSAEWEFAARGGNLSQGFTYSGSNTISDVAWYSENSDSSACPDVLGTGTFPVGQKTANELGIFDMSGNVAEWCFIPSAPAHRGGSFSNGSPQARLTTPAQTATPTQRQPYTGLRTVRSLP